MRMEKRQEYVLQTAQKNGFIAIAAAAEHLKVSIETVRRDINVLCQKNLLRKSRGGAVPVKLSIRKDSNYLLRIRQNHHEKIAIGAEAVKLIRDGDVVTMDGGATTSVLATCITGVQDVTFVVNSLHIAATLSEKILAGEITGRVFLIGGELDPQTQTANDVLAATTIDKYHFDLAFISCSSLSATSVSNSSISGALVRRFMDNASVRILVAESDKIGKSSVYEFAKPTEFDQVITDDVNPCPAELITALEESGTSLTIVSGTAI